MMPSRKSTESSARTMRIGALRTGWVCGGPVCGDPDQDAGAAAGWANDGEVAAEGGDSVADGGQVAGATDAVIGHLDADRVLAFTGLGLGVDSGLRFDVGHCAVLGLQLGLGDEDVDACSASV